MMTMMRTANPPMYMSASLDLAELALQVAYLSLHRFAIFDAVLHAFGQLVRHALHTVPPYLIVFLESLNVVLHPVEDLLDLVATSRDHRLLRGGLVDPVRSSITEKANEERRDADD